MASITKLALALLRSALVVAALVVVDGTTQPLVAQERSDRDQGRGGFRRFSRGSDSRQRDRDSNRDRDEDQSERKSDENESEEDALRLTTQTWAKGYVKQYDKNKNNWLDGDELQAAGRRAGSADANRDKVVTVDELVASATGATKPSTATVAAAKQQDGADKSSGTSERDDEDADQRESRRGGFFGFGERDRKSGDDRVESDAKSAATSKRVYTWTGGGKAGELDNDKRRTYRFTPAGERLPSGLPSWFTDKNGNGQLEMSEYSRTWSRSTVAKFQWYDLDGDGIVTAKEATAKK